MNRAEMIARLVDRHAPWDIVVIGGGATGIGIAVDAASRGYDVALLEQHDFGKGTSSRSTKLVHGGVRYLEQGNISLVMEALKERGILRQNAPHLVSNLAFVVPELRLVGGAVLRHRPQGLQRARRQVRVRRVAKCSRARRRCSACRRSRPTDCAAAWSTTTASSTTRGCSSTSCRPLPSRARARSTTRRSWASPRAAMASWTAWSARDAESGTRVPRRRQGGHQRDRALRRRRAAAGRARCVAR